MPGPPARAARPPSPSRRKALRGRAEGACRCERSTAHGRLRRSGGAVWDGVTERVRIGTGGAVVHAYSNLPVSNVRQRAILSCIRSHCTTAARVPSARYGVRYCVQRCGAVVWVRYNVQQCGVVAWSVCGVAQEYRRQLPPLRPLHRHRRQRPAIRGKAKSNHTTPQYITPHPITSHPITSPYSTATTHSPQAQQIHPQQTLYVRQSARARTVQ